MMRSEYSKKLSNKQLIDKHHSRLVLDSQYEAFFDTVTSLTSKLCHSPVALVTFIEDDFISFIKTYPSYWDMDENGSIQVLEDFPSPEIHYTGQIKDGLFEGIWEMFVAFKFEDGHIEQYDRDGTWTMFRI